MANDQLSRDVQDGISRGLSKSYRVDRELPDQTKELLGRLSLLDETTPETRRLTPDSLDRTSVERDVEGLQISKGTPTLTDSAVRRALNRYLNRLGAYLPNWLCQMVHWLREPRRLFARIVVSLLLVVGGVFSFLPVLGLWMLPLGLIVISQDLPILRRPLVRTFEWIERQWQTWRSSRRQ